MNIDELHKKAEDGDTNAQAELSLAYFTGDAEAKDRQLGRYWFKEACKERDSVDRYYSVEKLTDHPVSCYLV